jgi:FKBP-type peptidyl-prolyl cis-trans isomerase
MPAMSTVTTASGLGIEDLTVGAGPPATGPGQTVTVHYSGWLADGREFDTTRRRGEPFSFPLGVGYVIPGWDEGVVGMRVGGKRRLTVPPALGYGASGAGGVIPPNATLTFEIELLAISE